MRHLLVTTSWDDGHVADLRLADLMRKYGIKGTFYIAPKCQDVKNNKRLSEQEIRKLSRDFEIGAHTVTGRRLAKKLEINLNILSFLRSPKISLDDANKEIVRSKEILEHATGRRIISFCYPGGIHNKKIEGLVKKAGFSYARAIDRFKFDVGPKLAGHTTMHTYKHYQDLPRVLILARLNPVKFWKLFWNWDQLAIFLFDRATKSGGVYHLWGHSWEIDANDDWKRLEKVFAYISNQPNVHYVTNKQLQESVNKTIVSNNHVILNEVKNLKANRDEILRSAQDEHKRVLST